VVDNAEHVIDVAADLTEALTRCGSGLSVLTTSREPLRTSAETVFRVPPLDVPLIDAQGQEVLAYSAVRLFLRRARALQPRFADDAASVSLVGEICRRLDGIPLAIELAAARAATLGIDGLHRRLDDRLKVLIGGRRTAMPRHQTLRATFDWSYALLDPAAQAVFRRLSQFASTFSIEAASAVAADRVITAMSVTTSVGELAEKSLLGVEFDGPRTRYRLPESTRAYAREKLQDEGEVHSVAARHARYLQQRFEQHWISVAHAATGEPLDRLRHELDDARGALEWAFSPAGDERLGVELTGALVEALLAWSLVEECYTRANRAMAALVRLPSGTVDATCELRLRAALATALPHMGEAASLWHDVLWLATDKHNEEFQSRALWGLWNATLAGAQIHASLMYATLFQMLADERGIELQRILADHVVAVSLHSLGAHAEARVRLENVLSGLAAQQYSASRPSEFRADPSVVANGTLARIIWIQGDPDRAMAMIDAAVDSVSADRPEPSLSHVLAAVAVPLALLSGDLPTAARYLDMLRAQARLHRFEIWRECCDCLGAHLDILNGQFDKGLRALERSLVALRARGFRRLLTPPLGVYAQAQAHAGRTVEARQILLETLAFCNKNGEEIFSPDIWRILGVVALLEAHSAAAQGLSPTEYEADAQSSFLRAIQMAQQQGARMWELRAAVPLAQLWATQGRNIEATELLHPLCVLFPNPSVSSDVRTAHALMNELKQFNVLTGEKLHVASYDDRFGYFNSVEPEKSFPTLQGKQSLFASEQDFFYFNNFI
jgi:predicted ATPase